MINNVNNSVRDDNLKKVVLTFFMCYTCISFKKWQYFANI